MLKELLSAHIRISDQLELSRRQLWLCEQDIAKASCPFKVGDTVKNRNTGLSGYQEGLVEGVVFAPSPPHWSVKVALRGHDGSVTPYKATWGGEFIESARPTKQRKPLMCHGKPMIHEHVGDGDDEAEIWTCHYCTCTRDIDGEHIKDANA